MGFTLSLMSSIGFNSVFPSSGLSTISSIVSTRVLLSSSSRGITSSVVNPPFFDFIFLFLTLISVEISSEGRPSVGLTLSIVSSLGIVCIISVFPTSGLSTISCIVSIRVLLSSSSRGITSSEVNSNLL